MSKVKFIESTHKYLSDKGELVSVSKFVEQFKEKVDWDAIALKQAKKLTKLGTPTTKGEILKKWERKRNLSSQIGTDYHQMREDELINEVNPKFYNVVCRKKVPVYEDGFKYSSPINSLENNTVYPELMIYDEEHMICGQSDKVIVNDNKINVWDYKTDATIEFHGFSSKWVDARCFLPPISHLEECNGNLYALKMSMYMYLLWKANRGRLKTGEIVIEHVHLQRDPANDNIPILQDGKPVVKKIEQIKLPYLKKEVMAMLRH